MGDQNQTFVVNYHSNDDPAKIFLNESNVEVETIKQVAAMINNSHLSHARIMPDCHVGHGCCVGFTCKVDYCSVVPSYVGGDIGCGILTYPLSKHKLNLNKTEAIIKRIIPMGNGHNNVHRNAPVEVTFIEKYLTLAEMDVKKFAEEVGLESETTISTGSIDYTYFQSICSKIGMDEDVCIRSLGTLGGGNHFIEVNQADPSSELYLTIHSGSRTFGMKLFEYHNSKVDKKTKHLNKEDSLEYCIDMIIAQKIAVMNRHIMLQLILRELDIEYNTLRLIESIHNYIDFHYKILRKGAISAQENELCIVSLNMRDGILVCRGKGNEDWNYSCAHGCGRHMSRTEAARRIKLKDYKLTMRDVVSSSVCTGTLDEAPQAYKDMGLIVEALQDTVEIIQHLPSVINWKGVD